MRTCGFTHRELSDTRGTQKDSYGTDTLLFLVLSVFKAGLRKIHSLLKRGLITGVFPQSELGCRCSARDGGLHEAGKKFPFSQHGLPQPWAVPLTYKFCGVHGGHWRG